MSGFFSSYGFILKTLAVNVLNIESKNGKTKISAQSLLSTTFRIPERDRYSAVKAILYLIKTIIKSPVKKLPGEFPKELIFDVSESDTVLRTEYVKYFTGVSQVGIAGYINLISYPSFAKKIGWGLLFSVTLPIILPVIVFSSKQKRAGISLIIEEIIVLSNLLSICLHNKVKTIYHFSIYEVYSNAFAQKLMQWGVEVIKIPSEVPLTIWNKKIVASVLVICNAYQYEEIETYKKNMIFERTEFWGPELILNVKEYYKNQKNQDTRKPEFAIGFYSTGGWLRNLLGHIDQGLGIEEKEKKVQSALKNYAKKGNIKLGIFLHPREKKEEYLEKTKAHYKEIFEGVDYSFMPFDIPNNKLFDKVDLAVAFSTTIMFERLYCGFKCMFVPFGMEGFPLVSSPLKNVCVDSEAEFESKLDSLSKLTVGEYFEKNHLEVYSRLKYLS